jgi:hypothetical protein
MFSPRDEVLLGENRLISSPAGAVTTRIFFTRLRTGSSTG